MTPLAKNWAVLVAVVLLAGLTVGDRLLAEASDGNAPTAIRLNAESRALVLVVDGERNGHPSISRVSPPANGPQSDSADIDVYRGLGTWIDIYDVAWAHPGIAVRRMRAHGVRTLYLQTSNFSRGRPFVHPDEVRQFLDAAHRNGISVVAWYLPGLRDLNRDVRRTMAAIRLRTALGNGFDSFALDIESEDVRRPAARTIRLLRLSERIRRAWGADYPLGAIIPSPLRLQVDTHFWPRFPYVRLERLYDVFLPMTYFTYRVRGVAGAKWYTAGNIRIIRSETGDLSVPIHVIGGIGGDAGAAQTRGFVNTVLDRHVIGASYYTFPLISDPEWSQLSRVPEVA